MGKYINKGNDGFRGARLGEYVDKTGLISVINSTLGTERRFSCVSRSRRFGKSMAVKMLCAYYDETCDSHALFDDLDIAKNPSYETYLNKYPVIYLDITDFTTKYGKDDTIVSLIQKDVVSELLDLYPGTIFNAEDDLMDVLVRISSYTSKKFIMLIDEWDAILREFEGKQQIVDSYVNFLRRLFKGSASSDVFAGVYMTGILPIKKYKTESALNNFVEYSVTKPGKLSQFFGFTSKEVKSLCEKHSLNFSEMEAWYDGYRIGNEVSIFNPYSVMTAVWNEACGNYWSSTGTYDSVTTYIQMNFDGLKDDVIMMLSGERCSVDTTEFQNDLSLIGSKNDVLTILIHLGYLSYDWQTRECFIPNREVSEEMEKAVRACNWRYVSDALMASKALLEAVLRLDEAAVARGIELVHDENTSILSYNDENSLACVLSLAFYYAKNDYIVHREYASGKGFADIVLIPRRNVDGPAIVIELKYDKSVDTAIDQIKRKVYNGKVAEYAGDVLLVGITYDRKSKSHECVIEKASCR